MLELTELTPNDKSSHERGTIIKNKKLALLSGALLLWKHGSPGPLSLETWEMENRSVGKDPGAHLDL